MLEWLISMVGSVQVVPKKMKKTMGSSYLVTMAILSSMLLACCTAAFARHSSPADIVSAKACSPITSCPICVEDGCTGLLPGRTAEFAYTHELEKCVEYDWIPPSHCALIVVTELNIMYEENIEGDCAKAACNDGLPLSEECPVAWVRPH